MPEWEEFNFTIGQEPSRQLTTVRHIAHVPEARRIVEDERIKAGLVFDHSRLNTSRISVAWVSANTWGLGSIYGTVEFQFSWADLVAGQHIYWVEAMNYNPRAYRLLLSPRVIESDLVTPYDPATHQGPLKLLDGVYYWNGQYTSEFMIEDDLKLSRCEGLDFVMHHQGICRPYGFGCFDRQHQPTPQRSGGRLLAAVLARGTHVIDQHLTAGAQPFTPLDSAYSGLETRFAGVQFGGAVNAAGQCQNVVRGALALYAMDDFEKAGHLLRLISSVDAFKEALKGLVRTHFNNPGWEPG